MSHRHTPTPDSEHALYQYCGECGAVRLNQPREEWHICDLCRLPGGPR